MDGRFLLERLVNEVGLQPFPEGNFKSFKRGEAPKRSGPEKTKRQWFGNFMLELNYLPSGSYNVKVYGYNMGSGSLKGLLRSSGLSKFESEIIYGKSREILRGF